MRILCGIVIGIFLASMYWSDDEARAVKARDELRTKEAIAAVREAGDYCVSRIHEMSEVLRRGR